MKLSLFFIPLLLFSFLANASVILSERSVEKSFASPDLRFARFIEYKKRVDLNETPKKFASFMTDTRFAFHVSSPLAIENYAIVQYIRGCMFHSRRSDGETNKTLTIYRRHFSEDKIFDHRNWEVDTDTFDPIYTSDARFGRFALLRWNSEPASLDPETATFYARAKPPHGSVFATDLPGVAALSTGNGRTTGTATNTSLEFRTCLFEAKTLPSKTTPAGAGIDIAKALWCVEWSNRFVWDFTAGKMVETKKIDPVCETKDP